MATQAQIDSAVNEGGEGYSLAAQRADEARCVREAQSLSRFEIEQAAARAAFAAEWTVEVLAARRARWNAEMQALSAAKMPATTATIGAVAKRLGFSLSDIVRAKAMHGIA